MKSAGGDGQNSRAEAGLESAAWVVGGQVGLRLLGLLNVAIAARLLGPDAFGTLALGGMVVALLTSMSSFGFDWALVQQRPTARALFDCAWTWRVLSGGIITVLSILMAKASENFFEIEGLASITIALALIPTVAALENIGLVKLRISSIFRTEVQLALGVKVATILITASLAYVLRNVWALVIGMLASRSLGTVASYWVNSFRPRWRLEGVRQLMSFSGWYYLSTLLGLVRSRLPTALIGKFQDPFQTGLFQTGIEISYAPLTELIAPLTRIGYVRYTGLKSDIAALRTMFLHTTVASWYVVWPMCLMTFLLASEITFIVLGPQWIEAGPIIELLALGAVFISLGSTSGYLLMAIGKIRKNTVRAALVATLIAVFGMVWIPAFGALGAAYALVVGEAVGGTWLLATALREAGASFWSVVAAAVRPAASSISAFACGYLVSISQPIVALDDFLLLSVFVVATIYLAVFSAVAYVLWVLAGRPEGAETYLLEKIGDGARSVWRKWRYRQSC